MKIDLSQKELAAFFAGLPQVKVKTCVDCKKELSFFARTILGKPYFCDNCFSKRLDSLNKGIKEYSESLLEKLQDAELTGKEMAQLDEIKNKCDFSELAVKKASMATYHLLYSEIVSDRRVTENEMKQINKLAEKYGMATESIAPSLANLSRLRYISMLEDGILPRIETNIFLRKKEIPHLQTQCQLHEERTRKSFVGGHTGFSFRITKGVYWRIGAFKGHPVQREVLLKIDDGTLLITSKRLVFSGDRKSFSVPLRKLIDVEVFKDAIKVNREGKVRREYFLMAEPAIAAKVINLAVNQAV